MITSFFILVVNLVILSKAQNDAEVDYYVKLIKERIQKYSVDGGLTNASCYKPNSNDVSEFGLFDYIVIGGGAAGSVVASRLSEKKKCKVLLIEAGGQEDDFTDIPGLARYLYNSEYTWDFKTTPQNNSCLGMTNEQCRYPRGRGLGGSTIINSLHYIRGNKFNFDDWEKQGNPRWSYKDVLPLFLKSENASFNYTDPKYHRRGGYLNVEYAKIRTLTYYLFVKANIEMGQKVIDYNGARQMGVGKMQFNTIRGRRVSSNKAFLTPAYKRTNLKIMTHSYATKINIDKFTKEAYGVTFSHNKKLHLARARREIILSAGTFQSPQLLMLSGIGPKEELKNYGIPLIQHLWVGSNLHNEYALSLRFASNVSYPSVSLEQQVRDYLRGTGELTNGFSSESLSWFQTILQNRPDYPDIEITYVVSGSSGDSFNIRNSNDNETSDTSSNASSTFSLASRITQPYSRGKVQLNSSSPYEFPLIDPNAFNDLQQLDIETLYEGIKIVLDVANTEAFKKINATLLPSTHPQCKEIETNTKEYWFCQIKYLAAPASHPAGTCKMGADPIFGGAVVDHNLKVHGIKKLRVADASIIPTPITGHISAATMMIGEKVSQLINNK